MPADAELHGSSADPTFRRARAIKAANARHSGDALIDQLIRTAPAPTPEALAKLRAWLPEPAQADSADG